MNPFQDGYDAGIINDRNNPHPFGVAYWLWHWGNQAGLSVHCAIVEAVYLSEEAHG